MDQLDEVDAVLEAPPEPETEAVAGSSASRRRRPKPTSAASRATLKWARWLHVYASMIALLVILFFGLTGITLNHPNWTFGDGIDTSEHTGTLGVDTTLADGSVNFLGVSEYIRDTFAVGGHIDSFEANGGQGVIVYKNAGYSADLTFDVATKAFDLNVEQQGWVAVVNDLHKGRDTDHTWNVFIDIAAGFLVVVSITGLAMQLVLRKRRRSALISAGVGTFVLAILVLVTLR